MSHEESKTSVVDVFELSKNLRRDRHGIVCSLNHYNFIYQVRELQIEIVLTYAALASISTGLFTVGVYCPTGKSKIGSF